MPCGAVKQWRRHGSRSQRGPLLLSPPSDLFSASENLKAPKPDRPSLIYCRYTVSRPVRGSCAQWGPPMTRWPTWFLWTWSSTRRWQPRGTRARRRQTTGRRGGRNLHSRLWKNFFKSTVSFTFLSQDAKHPRLQLHDWWDQPIPLGGSR